MIQVPAINYNQEEFNYWWSIKGDWIEEPNQRRGGTSGVLRAVDDNGQLFYIKRQQSHIYRDIFHPFGQATIIREHKAYCQLAQLNVPTPDLVYCGVLKDKALLVTKSLEGFIDLDDWLKQKPSLTSYHAVLKAIASMLAKLHKGRLQHNSIYAKHIFVKSIEQENKEFVEVALLDLEKMKQRFTVKAAALHDMPKLKRHSLLTSDQWQYLIKQYETELGVQLPNLY